MIIERPDDYYRLQNEKTRGVIWWEDKLMFPTRIAQYFAKRRGVELPVIDCGCIRAKHRVVESFWIRAGYKMSEIKPGV